MQKKQQGEGRGNSTPAGGNSAPASGNSAAQILDNQRQFFAEGLSSPFLVRVAKLNALEIALQSHEKRLLEAYQADLGRGVREVWLAELGQIYNELRQAKRNVRRWMAAKPVFLEMFLQPAAASLRPEPHGSALILSPWNYPLLLSLVPLISAIAAGNTAVLKLSERVPRISRAIAEMLGEWFEPQAIAVLEGGPDLAAALTEMDFDFIFFTGSVETGKKVMQAAAKRLCPVVLELGGKSPAIIDASADLAHAAEKIAFGKFFAAGQTCIAPDHVYVEGEARTAEFLGELKRAMARFYGEDSLANSSCSQLVDSAHAKRMERLIADARQASESVLGGRVQPEARRCEPTIVLNPAADSQLMQEEIFGPVLPVICVSDIEEAALAIRARPKPLAAYFFSTSGRRTRWFLDNIPAGGAGINTVLLHAGSSRLPFGGVGQSGMGRYHGRAGFLAFSNNKSVLQKSPLFDLGLELPDSKWDVKTIKRFFR